MENTSIAKIAQAIVPPCTVFEDDDKVVVRVEMPGVTKDGLDVKLEGNHLRIEGRRPDSPAEGRWLVRERRRGSFRKTFTVDDTIARDGVEATLSKGVLTIRLGVKEAAKPRKIEIA